MIKHLKELNNKKSSNRLQQFLTNEISIYEKINTFYFEVAFSETKYDIIFNGRIISTCDRIINSMWDEPYTYFNNIVSDANIMKALNGLHIGFYFFPTSKPIMIEYRQLYMKSKYYINKIWKTIPNKNILNSDEIKNISKLLNIPIFEPLYVGVVGIDKFKKIRDYLASKITNRDIVNILIDGKTFSENKLDEIEGIIIHLNKLCYQVEINNVDGIIESSSEKRLYYDMFISDFIATMNVNNVDISSLIKHNYIEDVCNIFLYYIDHTDFIKKYDIEPSSLEPPHYDYFPKPNLSLLSNEIVKTVCTANLVYEKMFLILLNGLRKGKISYNLLDDNRCKKWNDIVNALK